MGGVEPTGDSLQAAADEGYDVVVAFGGDGTVNEAANGLAGTDIIDLADDETLLPGLGQEIVTSRMLTPQDFQDRLSSFKGAAFGLEPILTQSAWFRPHNRSEEVDRLYLVGAGTHPGAGLPGVLSSARVLDMVVPDAAEIRRR